MYGLTKAGAEGAAAVAAAHGLRVVIVRPFNHTGPGQRPDFAVPAFAHRILAARREGRHVIRAGNVDVRRDISDVGDVVVAYRLLVEAMFEGRVGDSVPIFKVASESAVAIRFVIKEIARVAGWAVTIDQDIDLDRPDDPPFIAGSHKRLTPLTGWLPRTRLTQTLRRRGGIR